MGGGSHAKDPTLDEHALRARSHPVPLPCGGQAAHYLGALCANVVLLASPEKIVLSGGVMLRASLFPMVRERMQAHLNGYIQSEALTTPKGVERFVGPSTWGNSAGVVGALTLAQAALEKAAHGGARRNGEAKWMKTMGVLAAGLAIAAVVLTRAR